MEAEGPPIFGATLVLVKHVVFLLLFIMPGSCSMTAIVVSVISRIKLVGFYTPFC